MSKLQFLSRLGISSLALVLATSCDEPLATQPGGDDQSAVAGDPATARVEAGRVLDEPTDLETAYSTGSQSILLRVQLGANNSIGTTIHVEISTVGSAGPWSGEYVGYDDGFGALIRIPYGQGSATHQVWARLWATKVSWIDSSRLPGSLFVPAR